MNEEAAATADLGNRFRVGAWLIDGNSLTASRGKEKHTLEPRAFQVLRTLAASSGVVVTVDELMDAHWGGTVVTPNAVTRVIAQLRKALDDDAKNPRYIETVSRTGYRLVAPVRPGATAAGRSRYLIAAVVAVVVVAIAVVLWMPRSVPEASVAVLPFRNLTGDTSLDYLADGLAEEVARSLIGVDAITVSGRLMQPSDTTDAMAAGRELDVAHVVVGSVRRAGPILRLTATVQETGRGNNVWSNTVEVDATDVFRGYDALAREVTEALARSLAVESPEVIATHVPDPEAYDFYLRGRHIWHRRGALDQQGAIDNLAEAVRIDPQFAKAWAALASAYLTYPTYSSKGYATWRLAEEAAQKANDLDATLAEPYAVLAVFAEQRLDWIDADAKFRQALMRNYLSPTAHYWYGEHLAKTGRYEESIHHMLRTVEIDPTYQPPQMDLVYAQMQFRNYEQAADEFIALWEKGFRSPECWAGIFISSVMAGDRETAVSWLDIGPLGGAEKGLLGRFVDAHLGGADDPDLVDEFFGTPGLRLDYRMVVWIAATLERYDPAFDYLDSRLDRGLIMDMRPLWNPGTKLGAQPRFRVLLERLGLIEYWETVGWGDVCREEAGALVCDASELTPDRIDAILANDPASRDVRQAP